MVMISKHDAPCPDNPELAESPLDESTLDEVAGGQKIIYKEHWYGDEYFVCANCGKHDFTICGVSSDRASLDVLCNKCGWHNSLNLTTGTSSRTYQQTVDGKPY